MYRTHHRGHLDFPTIKEEFKTFLLYWLYVLPAIIIDFTEQEDAQAV
jgi:hypothetical protein